MSARSGLFCAALAACAVAAAGCGVIADPEESVGRAELAIQGGAADASAPWVVGVLNEHFRTICSGSLLAPNVVLTTRHCLDLSPTDRDFTCDRSFDAVAAPNELIVASCADMHLLGASPSCNWHRSVRLERPADSSFCGADLALVILAEPISGEVVRAAAPRVAPLAIAATTTPFAVAGFGATSPHETGWGYRRRIEGMELSCLGDATNCSPVVFGAPVEAREFASASRGVCNGDSGGPAFVMDGDTPSVVGVASRGGVSGDDCVGAVFTRVDVWSSWISERSSVAVDAAGSSRPTWLPPREGAACTSGACPPGSSNHSACDVRPAARAPQALWLAGLAVAASAVWRRRRQPQPGR